MGEVFVGFFDGFPHEVLCLVFSLEILGFKFLVRKWGVKVDVGYLG